ncbi:16S rRNA (adenine(1518)-N(6)/adenine(1519)-N(6))-dimethyltransferase RsmA [Candidatus Omnitrophota bacterium]
MLLKKELKQIFLDTSFRPKRYLGQNFLIDKNIKDIIIAAAFLDGEDIVVEIGPGFGALTFDIAGRSGRVIAVEKDRRAFEALKGLTEKKKCKNIELIHGDILDFAIEERVRGKKAKVVGNLPYCVTTGIVQYLIEKRAFIDSALITVQREVANRLLAGPHSKDYGSITCYIRYYMEPAYVRTIRRGCFYPAPEVDSSLIRLAFRKAPLVSVRDEELLFYIIRSAFNQRRKTAINAIANQKDGRIGKEAITSSFMVCGIDARSRAEDLSLEDFARIADSIDSV